MNEEDIKNNLIENLSNSFKETQELLRIERGKSAQNFKALASMALDIHNYLEENGEDMVQKIKDRLEQNVKFSQMTEQELESLKKFVEGKN